MTNAEYTFEVLKLFADADCHFSLFWRINGHAVTFAVMCSDLFHWGTADSEDITPETLGELMQAFSDACEAGDGGDGPDLYCARRRKMRPQGAAYKYISEKAAPLFDACGPEREVGIGNPTGRSAAK